MASGVFGIPISAETVRATGEYKEPITQQDVADYTLKMINAGEKDLEAQRFVDNLKKKFGNGITAKCLMYNATGTNLTLATFKDWNGHIFETPYPSVIQNGQWGAFIHTRRKLLKGSTGAVVYRSAQPTGGLNCDWLFSWNIPFTGPTNMTYTEIRAQNYFPQQWNSILQKLERGTRYSSHSNYGYVSRTEIGNKNTSVARATFTYPY